LLTVHGVWRRFDAQHGADREVQRILLELLNQMDGFDQSVNVKVIMATNRQDTLDPALLRPGRLDRKVEFPVPDRRQKRLVFQAATAKMNLSDEVDLETFVSRYFSPCPCIFCYLACVTTGSNCCHPNRTADFSDVTLCLFWSKEECKCQVATDSSSNEADMGLDVRRPDKISNADIAAICLEAGMQAVRKNRYIILNKDFEKAYKATVKKTTDEFECYK